MTVSSAGYLKGFYDATRALGDKAVVSDATLEIEGFETMYLLTPQFPMPELSVAGEIEVPTPLGAAAWQPQQLKVHQQGSITLMETTAGHVSNMMLRMLSSGSQGRFNAKVYEGTPDKFYRAYRIEDCFIQLDNPDRNWEDRSQVLKLTGTIFFHFFGSTIPGTVQPANFFG
jgi:hypothetical protein